MHTNVPREPSRGTLHNIVCEECGGWLKDLIDTVSNGAHPVLSHLPEYWNALQRCGYRDALIALVLFLCADVHPLSFR